MTIGNRPREYTCCSKSMKDTHIGCFTLSWIELSMYYQLHKLVIRTKIQSKIEQNKLHWQRTPVVSKCTLQFLLKYLQKRPINTHALHKYTPNFSRLVTKRTLTFYFNCVVRYYSPSRSTTNTYSVHLNI